MTPPHPTAPSEEHILPTVADSPPPTRLSCDPAGVSGSSEPSREHLPQIVTPSETETSATHPNHGLHLEPSLLERKHKLVDSPAERLQESSHKRLKLPPHRRFLLDRFSFPPLSLPNPEDPTSPLFFSHRNSLRPDLPPRYSSSEAAVKMLSKAKLEEAQIKTVSLARGTVSTPALGAALQMRSTSDRSSVARSGSPESSAKAESPFSLISSIGVAEVLEQDERPTLIIDLGDSSNYGTGPLKPLFLNQSLRTHPGLFELVTGITEDSPPHISEPQPFLEFKSWALSASVDGESLNVCIPPFKFAGLSWSCSTLRKRLRLVSGTVLAGDLPPEYRKSRSPLAFSPVNHPASSPSKQIQEPLDYFGDATLNRSEPRTRRLPNTIVTTTESPHTPMLISPASRLIDTPDATITSMLPLVEGPCFDWTRLPVSDAMPPHIQFARSVDWASTALGPIETWSPDLRQMCNLIMASPHPAAMYWGDDLIAIYNEAYVALAGQKHPQLMGMSYEVAWKEIWDEVKDVFASARLTGEATMKDDDCLFMERNSYLEETYFSWSIIPMVGSDGSVTGLYNPCFEKTRRKIAERRMLTLREIGERTATARDVRGFWEQVLAALELNEFDTPFVLLYSVSDDSDTDSSSTSSFPAAERPVCHLEGSLGIPTGHQAAPRTIDLTSSNDGFASVFNLVLKTDKPLLLEVGSKDLPSSLLTGLESRGFGDGCQSVVVCPIHPTTGESTLGFLVLGVNPRRPYDEDYSLFVQLLSRQLATSLASVVLFEEEIRRGQRAAKLAALDRKELAEQLAARTQEAIESETRFTRMAEFAPVGMFIANSEGLITFCNDAWYELSRIPKGSSVQSWTDAIEDADRPSVHNLWRELLEQKRTMTTTFRFKTPRNIADGQSTERWVLFSVYPEKHTNGDLRSIFGSFTDISQQKWAEGFQKRKMEEAVELKRQQENFIDMTSHEMRNPLSAILQCADEISTTMVNIRKHGSRPLDSNITSALEAAQTIALCAQHQKRIVDDILTLSKLDSELLLVTPVDAQPLTVAQRALKMHEGELSTNDIKLKFVVDSSYKDLKIDWVRFDPSRVLQVLINLTTNAIKFTTTESERTIEVTISAYLERPSSLASQVVEYFPSKRDGFSAGPDWGSGEEVFVQFEVKDTGRGLTTDEKKMLFMRFSQASPRTHVQYGGSGLGLFISRQLTELQGGEIGVASEAGKGSTFAFYVRARRSAGPDILNGSAAAAGSTTTNAAAAAVPRPAGKKYILLVEDNLVNQRVLQKQLKNLGCAVQVANHGAEALEHMRRSTWASGGAGEHRLSVVLMDQEMPVMDGLTATRRIRAMEQRGELVGHVPVIAVTANARSEQIQTAQDAGMDDVVSKPFRIADLIPKVEELMGRYPEPGSAEKTE